jgi:hypothetical protein
MTVPKTDLYYSTSLLFHVIDSWLLSHLSFEMHKAESFAIAEATPLFFFWYSMLIFFRGVNSMFSGVHRIAVYCRPSDAYPCVRVSVSAARALRMPTLEKSATRPSMHWA